MKSILQKIGIRTGMVGLTYLIAVILLMGWAIGYYIFHTGNAIHLLLVFSMAIILTNIIRGV